MTSEDMGQMTSCSFEGEIKANSFPAQKGHREGGKSSSALASVKPIEESLCGSMQKVSRIPVAKHIIKCLSSIHKTFLGIVRFSSSD